MKHSDNQNEFDQMFKNAFEGLEMEPSTRVWLDIEKDLDKDKKTNRVIWIARLSIAASLVLAMFFGMYVIGTFDSSNNQEANAIPAENNSTEKNISIPMQPKEESNRLADVVEIKRKNINKPTKSVKKNLNEVKPKVVNTPSLTEQEEIQLLKKIEQESASKTNEPANAPEIKKPIVVQPGTSPSIASSTKKEVSGTVDVINYISSKISGNTSSNVVAVNEEKNEDGSTRKKYEVDLGIVKFSRVRSSN